MKTPHSPRAAHSPQRATRSPQPATRPQAGFATGGTLLIVLIMIGVSLVILSSTMRRTGSVAIMNERNNQHSININAAEAAVEKVVARMSYDFQNYGIGTMDASLATYRTNIPTSAENTFWGNFNFSDGQGNNNRTYVAKIGTYSGPLPSQYPGRTCINSPLYRVLSNVRAPGQRAGDLTAAVQVDVLAAMVPITQWAIFYNGLLEFSSCATMTVNGPVHANGNIYTGSGSVLTLNGTVTTTGTQTSPANNGSSSSWANKGVFNGKPPKSENVPTINLSIGTNMLNVHNIIDLPTSGVPPTNTVERARLYNLAQVIILVSNTTVTLRIQNSPSSGEVPGNDPSPTLRTYTNLTAISAATNLPFLTLSNTFVDQRESAAGTRKVSVADIDLIKYKAWIGTNTLITSKTLAPTILYIANNRSNSTTQMPGVRVSGGQSLPANGGAGFTVATPNPLYVKGHYNCPDAALGTTNTLNTVPAALMSDALTILSSAWQDTQSSSSYTVRSAVDTTVNAAILTGVMPSTGTGNRYFSGLT